MMPNFEVIAQCPNTRARAGVLQTAHGPVETPVFMPVGTLASVKSVTPDELDATGAQIILGNTYHLYLRPGCDVIRRFSGLHQFMNWNGPILTDSGGFQVFSLAKLARITESGVTFQSHIDGSRHHVTPEEVVDIQRCLDAVAHPNFKVWYDAGNIIYYTGKNPAKELKPIVKHVTGFCAKDCAGQGGEVMIQFGTGNVDFKNVFAVLKTAGFNGPIMVEGVKIGATPEETNRFAKANREFLEKVLRDL